MNTCQTHAQSIRNHHHQVGRGPGAVGQILRMAGILIIRKRNCVLGDRCRYHSIDLSVHGQVHRYSYCFHCKLPRFRRGLPHHQPSFFSGQSIDDPGLTFAKWSRHIFGGAKLQGGQAKLVGRVPKYMRRANQNRFEITH